MLRSADMFLCAAVRWEARSLTAPPVGWACQTAHRSHTRLCYLLWCRAKATRALIWADRWPREERRRMVLALLRQRGVTA
jgi:hypothetical protein